MIDIRHPAHARKPHRRERIIIIVEPHGQIPPAEQPRRPGKTPIIQNTNYEIRIIIINRFIYGPDLDIRPGRLTYSSRAGFHTRRTGGEEREIHFRIYGNRNGHVAKGCGRSGVHEDGHFRSEDIEEHSGTLGEAEGFRGGDEAHAAVAVFGDDEASGAQIGVVGGLQGEGWLGGGGGGGWDDETVEAVFAGDVVVAGGGGQGEGLRTELRGFELPEGIHGAGCWGNEGDGGGGESCVWGGAGEGEAGGDVLDVAAVFPFKDCPELVWVAEVEVGDGGDRGGVGALLEG